MAKRKNRTLRAGTRAKSRRKARINTLFAAAMAIPGLGIGLQSSEAQTISDAPKMSLQYWDYSDYQGGGQKRIQARSPMLWFRAPVTTKDEVEGSFVLDSVSGASPYYLSALSGASGKGISDNRDALDLKGTHYFDQMSVGLGTTYSTENDYDSLGIHSEMRFWTPDKNTTLALGAGVLSDTITSSIDSKLHESRTTENFLIGLTQVVDEDSILQSNLTFSGGQGYFSDPYKPLDNRPRHRDSFAWLTRYNRYLPLFDASLHLDYRLYVDSFGVQGHMMEMAWYQPLFETWMLRPDLRYYTQSAADFFQASFPPTDTTALFSADQRLSSFGGVTAGLKLAKDFGSGFSAQTTLDYLFQDQGLGLFSGKTSEILSFHAWIWSVGITKKF